MNRKNYAAGILEVVESVEHMETEDLILELGIRRATRRAIHRQATADGRQLSSEEFVELRRSVDGVYVAIKERAPKGVAVKAHHAADRFAKWQKTTEEEFREEASQIAALFTE